MNIYHNIKDFNCKGKTAITIGTFDGVHVGHRKILKRLVNSAKKEGLQSVLLTFFPHPRMVLQHNSELKLINTLDEKVSILEETGLDHLIIHPFTLEFSRLSAQTYVEDILVKQLYAKHIIIGYDHRFGRNRTADINDLKAYGNDFKFKVEEISKQDIEKVAVSSTKIRTALTEGDLELANKYLTQAFKLSGQVVKGKGIGKDLGFATANLHIQESYKLIPKSGVYVVKTIIGGKTLFGMMNIGTNPTFNEAKQSIEAHFFDFNQDLYGKHLSIMLLKRLRSEEKFNDINDLILAMQNDKIKALDYISKLADA
ncbi:bifunctional riboflavin kinase/FAD synthetase [Psychroflexus sp. ALD_RP9]|uniref:bifunctional riboflavin kinase/FAD synthetase n=1 Tax=Psychroflexus sp. ALD_RP9 TaxID=2777186 RepID=UPI001A8CC81A|nr:bifunctional riboflavin kinase/FAD synthetase [Psychroflexus sp. ALD_RP9]QSS96210.1 bifunctional riboflavin kinase/FAD synthetase [Psychroflexus sp. ALD_RP9]